MLDPAYLRARSVWAMALIVCVLTSPAGAQMARHHYSERDLAVLPLWTVTAPDLTIGVLDGADPYVFAGLGSIQALADGSTAAANWSPPEIRIFDASGRHLRSLGRQGSGPGEWVQLVKLFRLGADSLATWDVVQGRGPIYAIDGGYGRQVSAPTDGRRVGVAGTFSDGTLLILASSFERDPDVTVLRAVYLHADGTGRVLDSIGAVPQTEMVLIPEIGYWTNRTFSAHGIGAAGPESVWMVDGSSPRLRQVDRTGAPISETTWDPGDRRVTRREIDLHWEQYEARGEDWVASAQRRRHLPVEEEFPATGRLLVDADGLVWVQVNTRPSQPAERWLVADATGRLIARVEAPEGFSLRDAAAGSAYGVGRDEWDVERLERRPIGKTAGNRPRRDR